MIHAGEGAKFDVRTGDPHLALVEIENLPGPGLREGRAAKLNRELAAGATVIVVHVGQAGITVEPEDVGTIDLQVDPRAVQLGRVQPDQSPHASVPQWHTVFLLLGEAVVTQIGGGNEI